MSIFFDQPMLVSDIGSIIAISSILAFIVWRKITNENGTTDKWHKWQCLLFIPAAIGYVIQMYGFSTALAG